MGTCRADALVLEIDVSRSAQSLLQVVCPYKRRASVGSVHLPELFRNRNPLVGSVEFLVGTFLAENRIKVLRLQGLPGCRIEDWKRLVRHYGLHVEEMGRNLGFA